MPTGDWFMLVVAVPAIVTVGWVQTVRVWRRGADVSAGVTRLTGGSSTAGYHAFLLPGTICFTLVWLGILLTQFSGAGSLVDRIGTWLMALSLLFLALSFWMWLFARPRFLVPPHLRGQPGWAGAARRDRRESRRERKQARAYTGERGKRAARGDAS